MIQAGALVVLNHSGGKDSQAMTILLSRVVPRARLVAVHDGQPMCVRVVSGWLRQGREGGKLSVGASGFAAADNPEASGPGLRDDADR